MQHHKAREQFGRLIGETHRLWRGHMNDRLRPLGLSQARWTTLRELARGGDAVPQAGLAARMGIEAATLVGILDGLVSSGFVRRRPSRSDRRVKTVHLTAKARRQLEVIEIVAREVRLDVTRELDPATMNTAIAALEQVKSRLANLKETP
jgi:MarR family transcriptional regulator for hemolysin